MSLTVSSYAIASRVSRAPPHRTLRRDLPTFLNLHGRRNILEAMGASRSRPYHNISCFWGIIFYPVLRQEKLLKI